MPASQVPPHTPIFKSTCLLAECQIETPMLILWCHPSWFLGTIWASDMSDVAHNTCYTRELCAPPSAVLFPKLCERCGQLIRARDCRRLPFPGRNGGRSCSRQTEGQASKSILCYGNSGYFWCAKLQGSGIGRVGDRAGEGRNWRSTGNSRSCCLCVMCRTSQVPLHSFK